MLTKVERLNFGVETSLNVCIQALKERNYQITIFGERRLLCVKRSQQKDFVLTLEIVFEAFSRYETNVTLIGKQSERSLAWEVNSEVNEIAAGLNAGSQARNRQPAQFPLNALQVCIV